MEKRPNVSPFARELIDIGGEETVLNTSPFVTTREGEEEAEGGRAYYTLQAAQVIPDTGFITLSGPLQIIGISGNISNPTPRINQRPFGSSPDLKEGFTVTLYGTSDSLPIEMVNSRTIDYGVWLNGAVTFYQGYSIQLQLVKIGTLLIWLQISKNF